MLSPHRIQPDITNKRSKGLSITNLDNNSHDEYELRRPQLTSNEFVKPNTNTEFILKRTSNKKNKNIPIAKSVNVKNEINDKN